MSLFDTVKNLLPIGKKAPQVEYYFAIYIEANQVTAAVWGIEQNQLHVINSSTVQFLNNDDFLNEHTQQSLIKAANRSLDEALADFQPEPTKLLFGVPENWLEEDNLRPEFLKLLKKMVKELDVLPLAYVSSVHALSHFLQKQQGVPVTAILVGVENEQLLVSVIKAGKIIATKLQARTTNNLPSSIEKTLLQFTDIEVMPSKIIIYGQEDLNSYKDELSGFSWTNQLPFLHIPKVEILSSNTRLQAICFAGASELVPEIESQIIDERNPATAPIEKIGKSLDTEEDIEPIKENDNLADEELSSVGFVKGEAPVKSDNLEEEYPEEEVEDETDEPTEEAVGMGRRGASSLSTPVSPVSASPLDKLKQTLPVSVSAVLPMLKEKSQSLLSKGSSGGVVSLLKNKFTIAIAAIFVLFLLAFIFLPKAKVVIALNTQSLQKESQVITDPNIASVDVDSNKIPAKIIETDITDKATGQATGKTQVGDPAKGQVIIYNATSKLITLSKGSVLTTDSGLKFTLDESVQVASKSASAAAPPATSRAVSATASDIGTNGNIPAATELKVTNYAKSDVVAKVDTAFSGGSSKEVVAVTADDQKKLLNSLSASLQAKAKDQLHAKLGANMKMLDESITSSVVTKDYSKQVGDQASDFSLTLTNHYKATAYSEDDLNSIVEKLVQSNVPAGFQLDLNKTETQTTISKVDKDGKITFNANFNAKLTPKIDTESLKKKITGKSISEAENILKNVDNVASATIEVSPHFPGFLARLPFQSKNISITTVTN